MSEKKDDVGCGGNCCGCHGEGAIPDSGTKMAQDALREMEKCREKKDSKLSEARQKELENAALEETARMFLQECEKNEADPMEVIAHIAKRENLSLLGEPPTDPEKRYTYDLLRAAVKNIVVQLLSAITEEYGFKDGSITDLIRESILTSVHTKPVSTPRVVSVGVIPLRIRYGFCL